MVIPAVLIIGESGTGKSTSIKNLDKTRTSILNTEKKVLPFKNANEFVNNKMLDDAIALEDNLTKAIKDPNIDNVVIESFHRYSSMTLDLAKKINPNPKNGYEPYNIYYARICQNFLTPILKAENKFIFIFAFPEIFKVENPNGSSRSKYQAAYHGKLFEKDGGLEGFFSIVLYTSVVIPVGSNKGEYTFTSTNDGMNTAKAPEGMFESKIPNDLNIVKQKMNTYYNIKPKEELEFK